MDKMLFSLLTKYIHLSISLQGEWLLDLLRFLPVIDKIFTIDQLLKVGPLPV